MSKLRKFIIREEGNRSDPYLDCCGKFWRDCVCRSKGNLTVGVGRNLDANGLSEAEREYMFANDLKRVTAIIKFRFPWFAKLNGPRKAVLVGMAMNMGIGGLLTFEKFLAAAEAGDHETAAKEILDSDRARIQLPARSAREAEMWRTGQWGTE